MKRLYKAYRNYLVYSIFNILLVFIIVFSLLPNLVLAQNFHGAPQDLTFQSETSLTPTVTPTPSAIPSPNPTPTPTPTPPPTTTPSTNATVTPSPIPTAAPAVNPTPTPPPLPTPGIGPNLPPNPAAIQANPDTDNTVQSFNGQIKLQIPRGAISEPLNISLSQQAPGFINGKPIVKLFDLQAASVQTGQKVSQFQKNLPLSIQNNDLELRGIDPDSLRLYYLDDTTHKWIPVPGSQFDKNKKVLTAPLTHFSNYGEIGNYLVSGPGRVMAAQVDLHTGASSFSYPLDLPPGPGGFQPKLQLTYNSGSVDEQKDKQSTASWVGLGWSFNPGRISYDLLGQQYYLELNGASYQLISSDGVNYHTVPEQYYQITRSTNVWNMKDRDGNSYQFGGNNSTSHAQQYVQNGIYYRWDLNSMQDPNSNQATFTYTQDVESNSSGSWVRSAYPSSISYGSAQITFNCSGDVSTSDGTLRYDDPISTTNNPAPKVMENRHLDSVVINFNGSLVRKYTFGYNIGISDSDLNSQSSSDYGGIYYAGMLKLLSITQYGADNSSTLPSMTFSYQDLQLYRNDSSNSTYSGNPGNPATLNWAYLQTINSGYGGTSTFSYTQNPTSGTQNLWTREVVTGKTVNPGIGSSQSYTYSYTGSPQYLGTGWDQKYRGFGQVQETDAAGNYVIHYYYTTGTAADGKDGEKLTGREYQTKWYNNGGTLLKETDNTWNWNQTTQVAEGSYLGTFNPSYIVAPGGIAIGNDGNIYVQDGYPASIVKFDPNGTYLGSFSSYYISYAFGVAISKDGYIYIASAGNNSIVKLDSSGNFIAQFTSDDLWNPEVVAVSPDGTVYAATFSRNYIVKFSSTGTYLGQFSSSYLSNIWGIGVSNNGNIYVSATNSGYIREFSPAGTYLGQFSQSVSGPFGVAVSPDGGGVYTVSSVYPYYYKFDSTGGYVGSFSLYIQPYYYYYGTSGLAIGNNYDYVVATECYGDGGSNFLDQYTHNYLDWNVQLAQTDEISYNNSSGSKTSQIRYAFDSYGNVVTEYHDGDTSTSNDDSTVWRLFYPNTTANILDKPARVRTYATTVTSDAGGSNLKQESDYYYDGNNTSLTTPPTKGNLTRLQQFKDSSNSVSSYNTYDTYGNKLTQQDPNSNITTWTYDSSYHTYPATKAYPISGLSESYTYDTGTNNLLTQTDVNSQVTYYYYDTFKRLTSVVKPGDSSGSPSTQYSYNNWGSLGSTNSQNIKTITKISGSSSLWQTEYFDGLGRVIQNQAQGETGYTIISATTVFNNCGQTDKTYVSQNLNSSPTGYVTPDSSWKYTSYVYDGLGRVTTQNNADGTSNTNNYSNAWQALATDQNGHQKRNYYDAFQRLVKVEELNTSGDVYATTNYSYDVLGNLTQVKDNSNNTTTMNYNWLSQKLNMTDPDMGYWQYVYDNNGNLYQQTDAKSQTITMSYDAMNRLTGKTYPSGSGMTNVSYGYDDTTGGNYGKGQRTSISDALGTNSTTDKYDNRGRLVQESKTIDSNTYTTQYSYDGADRISTVTYPGGEVVTETYNGRGLPYTLSGSSAGNLVNSVFYNGLGAMTDLNLNNGTKTSYGYYGTGGSYDTTGGYYGKLWEIKTVKSGNNPIQDVQHTWDAAGNLSQRQDLVSSETENFSYDFLDRITGVSGAYSQSYSYDPLGNITAMNGNSYSYGSKPHAVTTVGSTSYAYDSNGNMTTRGSQTLTWDVENRPVTVTGGASFVYDGDGNRVKKIEGGNTTVYPNKYYEKNTTSGVVTTHYFLGNQQIAVMNGGTVSYIQQDHLSGTTVIADTSGASTGTIRYLPFGSTRSTTGTIPTDEKFTGQRLDGTGLYYYNARYYDPSIGRFISPDTMVPDPANPQSLNRYAYSSNNPLKYIDPSGHFLLPLFTAAIGAAVGVAIYAINNHDTGYTAGGWAKAAISGAVAGALAVTPIPFLVGYGAAGVGTLILAGGVASMTGTVVGDAVKSEIDNTRFDPSPKDVAISFGAGMVGAGVGRYVSQTMSGSPLTEITTNYRPTTFIGALYSGISKGIIAVLTKDPVTTASPSPAGPPQSLGGTGNTSTNAFNSASTSSPAPVDIWSCPNTWDPSTGALNYAAF